MLTSSEPRPAQAGRNGKEDTESREALGATRGEKPPKGWKPKDGTGMKQGRAAVEEVRNLEDAAELGR
jgi:hypothetical protein